VLSELHEWLTTPCDRAARRLGYLGEAIALGARHARNRQAWQPHLDATKEVVRSSIALCPRRRRAVVLGSGLLLDIPLDALAESFEQVELIDFVHLKAARRIAAGHANVTLRTADVSGLAADLLAAGRGGPGPTRAGQPPALAPDTDLVVSANLLSQLPDLPTRWLARKAGAGEQEVARLSREIVRGHLDWLAGLDATVCLVTETERAYIQPDGTELRSWDALFGEALPAGGEGWFWDIATTGEVASGLAVRNRVCGIAGYADPARAP